MRYYYCDKYPIEFVLSENIEKYFDSHNHVDHYVVSVVVQGKVMVCLENKEEICGRGDVFIIPPYALHSVSQGRDARLLSMCIGTDFIEKNDLGTAENIVRVVLKDAVEQGIFEKEQEDSLLDSMQAIYHLRDHGRKEIDAGIKKLTDIITCNPERELPIEILAADIFISRYYLIRKFKGSIGMTPHRFCVQNRIRKAQRMLDTAKTISEIAAEMGFYDQSHFDKAFRKIVGISPSEYIHSKRMIKQVT